MILIPLDFPTHLPEVFEVAGRIPRIADYHVSDSGSLCLGSPLRIYEAISGSENPLLQYIKACLEPYLSVVTLLLTNKADSFVLGELPHGIDGLYADYQDLLKVRTPGMVIRAFDLLSRTYHDANKHACACGCNKRLGACKYRCFLDSLRRKYSRDFFKQRSSELHSIIAKLNNVSSRE